MQLRQPAAGDCVAGVQVRHPPADGRGAHRRRQAQLRVTTGTWIWHLVHSSILISRARLQADVCIPNHMAS